LTASRFKRGHVMRTLSADERVARATAASHSRTAAQLRQQGQGISAALNGRPKPAEWVAALLARRYPDAVTGTEVTQAELMRKSLNAVALDAAGFNAYKTHRRQGTTPGSGNKGKAKSPEHAGKLRDLVMRPEVQLRKELGRIWKTEVLGRPWKSGELRHEPLAAYMRRRAIAKGLGGRPRKERLPTTADGVLELVARVMLAVERDGKTQAQVAQSIGPDFGWPIREDGHGNHHSPMVGRVHRLSAALRKRHVSPTLAEAWASAVARVSDT
jgi:hypothetical protein